MSDYHKYYAIPLIDTIELTKGNRYDILDESEVLIRIIDNTGTLTWQNKSDFLLIAEHDYTKKREHRAPKPLHQNKQKEVK